MAEKINIKSRKTRKIILWLSLAIFFLFLLSFIFINQPLKPNLITNKIDDRIKVDSPLEIQFDWPVSRRANITFEPEVTGELSYKNKVVADHLARTVVFTPELNFWPETTYKVKISNVKNALPSLLAAREYTFTFTTESQPKIKSVTPEVTKEINADSEFNIVLDKNSAHLAEFEYRFLPSVDFDALPSEDGKTLTLIPKSLLSQGQAYQFSIWRKKVRNFYQKNEIGFQSEPEGIWTGEYKVREAPYLSGFSPSGENIGLNEEISVIFNEPIESASFKDKVSIAPALTGDWQSEDQKTYTLKNATLVKDTNYKVLIRQGLKTVNSGYFAVDAVHTFKTIGPVKAALFSPSERAAGISVNRSLSVTFDQAVDHTSGQNHFILEPAVEGDFSWEGEVLSFKPKTALAFNTVYHLTIAKGVKGEEGFDSEVDYNISFTTELSVTKLSAFYHHQEHNLSCEAAALLMGLLYRGVSVSETALINDIGFDSTPKSGGVWGDPNVAFVGDINGRQPSTGYGVYWNPVAKAASLYRSSRVITGGKITDLTAEIQKGNPVVVWGTAGTGKRIDWKNTAGQNIVAVSGEHARLMIGFIGSADNPTKIITLDPLAGERHFTIASFLWNWGLLGSSGVVVE